ncbi:putative electron carrier mycofactocin [Mycobacterium kiyosense]|uniref:Electron carrier mycofactocin n=1 Tax=Mycobacterium kiyosense TaxID=2871094 RepID=A0A9P3Q6K2_9MYCO|nr:putative electron carrier mycofactocin [Mycobacterium kiyosense]BDE12383.1 putative electron carrier mycofactocin [Mycobacterium sp. 20KCMC460]GLB85559.1 putative electron carrier mycofactocin [Mycobacterium kiyosense]GLB88620.1 putative electron carrier mycofactocin [Mycobacterium kiyosense]GLB98890.1 putative electron carrier mycofactocin [Mycobacterium kiyosense]
MCNGVVERRRPTRDSGNISTRPSITALDAIFLSTIVTPTTHNVYPRLSPSSARKASDMDNENQTETELVTEILVEEVSIDGMCGVY